MRSDLYIGRTGILTPLPVPLPGVGGFIIAFVAKFGSARSVVRVLRIASQRLKPEMCMPKQMKKSAKPAVYFALTLCLSGCAVQPWERGTLAKPHMALEPHPMQSSLKSHNYQSREASSGGGAASGGGCGCY